MAAERPNVYSFPVDQRFALRRSAIYVMTAKQTAKSKRPSVAIGHVILHARNVTASAEFYSAIGLRLIVKRSDLAILELRGGTHLLLFEAKRKPKAGPMRSFDFMVDDITS